MPAIPLGVLVHGLLPLWLRLLSLMTHVKDYPAHITPHHLCPTLTITIIHIRRLRPDQATVVTN